MNVFKVSVVGQSGVGKSKFISSFFANEEIASLLYFDNTLGKTEMNTRYIMLHDDAPETLEIDPTRVRFNSHAIESLIVSKSDTCTEYTTIGNITNEIRKIDRNFSFSRECSDRYKSSAEDGCELIKNEICTFIQTKIARWDMATSLSDLSSYVEEIAYKVKMHEDVFNRIGLDSIEFVDTRGVFDKDRDSARSIPTGMDANILMIREQGNTAETLEIMQDRLKGFFNIPTEVVLRCEVNNIKMSKTAEEEVNRFLNICDSKKSFLDFKAELQKLGFIPSGNLGGNSDFACLLSNNLGSGLPGLSEDSDDPKKMEEVYRSITVNIVKKLIDLFQANKNATEVVVEKLQNQPNCLLEFKVPLTKISMEFASDVFNGKSSLTQKPMPDCLSNHLKKEIIKKRETQTRITGWPKEYLHAYITEASAINLNKYIVQINMGKMDNIYENMSKTKLNEPEKLIILRHMLNYISNLPKESSYEWWSGSVWAIRTSLNAFNSGVQFSRDLCKKHNGEFYYTYISDTLNMNEPNMPSIFASLLIGCVHASIDEFAANLEVEIIPSNTDYSMMISDDSN